jgi:heme A synthase
MSATAEPGLRAPGTEHEHGERERWVSRRQLVLLAGAMALLAWLMMTVGAYVRATESGLGCPDWPACHGQLVVGGHHALIEEIHRWVGTVLVIGVMSLAVLILRRYRSERRVLIPTLWTIALLALQVVLGGVTVLLKNVSWTVVAHYGGASLLIASIALVGVRLAYPSSVRPERDSLSRLINWFVALGFGLLIAGSTLANTDSDTVCGHNFPLCQGKIAPSVNHQVVINLTHRVWAGATLALALWVYWRCRRERTAPVVTAASACAGLFLIQAALGAVVAASGGGTAIDVIHSSVASLTWLALAALLALNWTLSPPRSPARPAA